MWFCLEILDSETGKSLKKIFFRMEDHHEAEMAVVVSEDLRWAAIPAANQENPSVMTQWHALYLVDLEEGTSRRMLDTQTEIVTMKFLEGRLALIRGSGYTLTTRHSNVSYQYTTPIQVEMETYDPATGRRYWSSSQQYYLRDDSIDTLNLFFHTLEIRVFKLAEAVFVPCNSMIVIFTCRKKHCTCDYC